MKGDKALWHRRNNKWTKKDIDALIEMRLVQFLPSSYATKQPRLKADEQKTLRSQIAAKFKDDLLAKLDALVDELRPFEVTDEELEATIRREVVKLIPPHSTTFVVPEDAKPLETNLDELIRQGVWDLTLTLSATHYVRVSLGLHPTHKKPSTKDESLKDKRQRRMDELVKTPQSECVLEWTDVYSDLWNNPVWRECLSIRYEMGNPPAVDLLPKKTRHRLDQAAKRLKGNPSGPPMEQIELAANGEAGAESARFSLGVLRFDYLVTKMAGGVKKTDRLLKPAHESGLFARIALLQAEHHDTELARSNFCERFCRYLVIPPGHPFELVGRLIVRLMKIESDYWDRQPNDIITPQKSVHLPKLRRGEMIQSEDFKTVADKLSAALEIDRNTLTRIWADWCGIKIGHFWQRRAASKYTAYWMANILEAEHDTVFRIYCKWIERFQVDILRPLLSARRADEIGVRKAALGPFQAALLDDPLLQAVLHYEVFNGKATLAAPRWETKRDANGPIKLIVTHAYRMLLRAHPKTPSVSIENVLSTRDLKSPDVRTALTRTAPGEHVGGLSHFAYVAPLVTSLINTKGTVITRDMAKDIHRRNKASHLLGELESEPDRLLTRIIRGETQL